MAQTARSIDPLQPREPACEPSRTAQPHTGKPHTVVAPIGSAPVEWEAESPARLLHQELLAAFGAPQPVRDDRLPLRTRLAIIAAAVLAPWVAIATAVLAIV